MAATTLAAALAIILLAPVGARAQLPRSASEILIIGDSVAAGLYFLELDDESIEQSWTGQVLQRLGIAVPRAPFGHPFPINHLKLAREGFGPLRVRYAWAARRALYPGKPRASLNDERVVIAVPGQTVAEVLTQSSHTDELNSKSAGWIFANIMLPSGATAIETAERRKARPAWIIVFIGANDVMSSFGMIGAATPPDVETFRSNYAELTGRLSKLMAPDSPARQLIVSTLPDVTLLPFLQTLPPSADDGKVRFPAGSKASAFLIPYRSHFEADEVWTPDELEEVRRRTSAYNEAITGIARDHGYTVVDIAGVSRRMAADSTFSSVASPYFSPDLHHPSFRAHHAIADRVIEAMAAIANAAVPDTLAHPDPPLPSAADMVSRRRRINALMHLAIQGLQTGPLPGKVSWRISLEGGGQFGDERVGDAVFVALGGIEGLPVPVSTCDVLRLCAHARVTAVALDTKSQEASIFPSRGIEGRLGFGFERIGAWSWQRIELGGLVTPDDSVDFGLYAREEWRALYVEAASRGWLFDRVEIGFRFGHLWGRPGRNGN